MMMITMMTMTTNDYDIISVNYGDDDDDDDVSCDDHAFLNDINLPKFQIKTKMSRQHRTKIGD